MVSEKNYEDLVVTANTNSSNKKSNDDSGKGQKKGAG